MPSLSWNCTADSVFLHAKIIGFIMLNRSNMYKMLAGLLLCLTSCNADPLKTFEVYVREDFILSEKPVAEFKKEESRLLPQNIDYSTIAGLRLEARDKLAAIRPMSIGQAGRISGVSPADIAVLLIWLEQNG